jgi:ElaB/YqjD/DUF883 family membrane-anchored ribosome-binding protein
MSIFTGSDKPRRWDIEARIEALRDELASLRRDAARGSRGAYESAKETGYDFLSELPHMSRAAVPAARRQARIAEQAVRDHPTAAVAVAGLVLIGLAASVIYSRR